MKPVATAPGHSRAGYAHFFVHAPIQPAVAAQANRADDHFEIRKTSMNIKILTREKR